MAWPYTYNRDWARELSRQGLSQAEIARRLGISRQRVWAILHPERPCVYNKRAAFLRRFGAAGPTAKEST